MIPRWPCEYKWLSLLQTAISFEEWRNTQGIVREISEEFGTVNCERRFTVSFTKTDRNIGPKKSQVSCLAHCDGLAAHATFFGPATTRYYPVPTTERASIQVRQKRDWRSTIALVSAWVTFGKALRNLKVSLTKATKETSTKVEEFRLLGCCAV
jgi:hypothetical protein